MFLCVKNNYTQRIKIRKSTHILFIKPTKIVFYQIDFVFYGKLFLSKKINTFEL